MWRQSLKAPFTTPQKTALRSTDWFSAVGGWQSALCVLMNVNRAVTPVSAAKWVQVTNASQSFIFSPSSVHTGHNEWPAHWRQCHERVRGALTSAWSFLSCLPHVFHRPFYCKNTNHRKTELQSRAFNGSTGQTGYWTNYNAFFLKLTFYNTRILYCFLYEVLISVCEHFLKQNNEIFTKGENLFHTLLTILTWDMAWNRQMLGSLRSPHCSLHFVHKSKNNVIKKQNKKQDFGLSVKSSSCLVNWCQDKQLPQY